jgi:hypothetical protein
LEANNGLNQSQKLSPSQIQILINILQNIPENQSDVNIAVDDLVANPAINTKIPQLAEIAKKVKNGLAHKLDQAQSASLSVDSAIDSKLEEIDQFFESDKSDIENIDKNKALIESFKRAKLRETTLTKFTNLTDEDLETPNKVKEVIKSLHDSSDKLAVKGALNIVTQDNCEVLDDSLLHQKITKIENGWYLKTPHGHRSDANISQEQVIKTLTKVAKKQNLQNSVLTIEEIEEDNKGLKGFTTIDRTIIKAFGLPHIIKLSSLLPEDLIAEPSTVTSPRKTENNKDVFSRLVDQLSNIGPAKR